MVGKTAQNLPECLVMKFSVQVRIASAFTAVCLSCGSSPSLANASNSEGVGSFSLTLADMPMLSIISVWRCLVASAIRLSTSTTHLSIFSMLIWFGFSFPTDSRISSLDLPFMRCQSNGSNDTFSRAFNIDARVFFMVSISAQSSSRALYVERNATSTFSSRMRSSVC